MKLRGENPYPEHLRDLWRPAREITVDRWAEERIVLPTGAAPGPISFDVNPYLREPLRCLTRDDVAELVLCFSTQVGKSTFLHVALLHSIAEKKQPALLVLPTIDDAREVSVEQLQPIVRESPELARLWTGRKADLKAETIRLRGVPLKFVGSNSPAALARKAIGTLAFDETDKYPSWSGREADPISLGTERTRTYVGDSKILKVSTVTTDRGYIWGEWESSEQRLFEVPCPHCSGRQVLVLGDRHPGTGGIKWPKGARGPEIGRGLLAWYECEHCHERIDDVAKPAMLAGGRWTNPEASGKVGFRLSCLYSPWLTWSDIASKFLEAQGNQGKLMNFRNSWLAEVWEDRYDELRAEHLRRRVQPYPLGEVPEEAHVLTAAVDVQADHFWFLIRAWGQNGRSWLVRLGQVPTWELLSTRLFRTVYRFRDSGHKAKIAMVMIDSGWGERTDEVYRYCELTGCQAVKGYAERPKPWQISRGLIGPKPRGKRRREVHGRKVSLVTIDTSYYKTMLHRLTRTTDGDPENWNLPTGLPEEYFRHMTAEQRVRSVDKRTGRVKLEWKVLHEGARNDYFDCEVYNLCAADVLDLFTRFTDPPRRKAAERSEEPSHVQDPTESGAETEAESPPPEPKAPPKTKRPPKRPQRLQVRGRRFW